MGITIMVQTKKEFIIIPKCTIAMLSNPHSQPKKNCCQTHMGIFSSTYYCQKIKNKKREEEEEAKPNT